MLYGLSVKNMREDEILKKIEKHSKMAYFFAGLAAVGVVGALAANSRQRHYASRVPDDYETLSQLNKDIVADRVKKYSSVQEVNLSAATQAIEDIRRRLIK